MTEPSFNIEVIDRYPLLSQRGNFSGKASQFIKSIISGTWWRSDPSTGHLPDTVERNNQFYINQGPVDMGIVNAQATNTPVSLDARNLHLLGTYLPKNTFNDRNVVQEFKPQDQKGSFREVYLWHPFTTKAEDFIEFSIVPTTY
jgi:hypothetical protein